MKIRSMPGYGAGNASLWRRVTYIPQIVNALLRNRQIVFNMAMEEFLMADPPGGVFLQCTVKNRETRRGRRWIEPDEGGEP